MVDRIKALLETRQLTPTQFADLIGTARPIVSHVLSGRNKPSLEVVQRILAALPELSMAWLLNGTGDMYTSAADAPASTTRPPALPEAPVTTVPPVATPPVAAAPSVAAPTPVPPPTAPVPPPMSSFTARKPTYASARTSSAPVIRRFTPQQPEAAHIAASAPVASASAPAPVPESVPAPPPVQPLVEEPVVAPVPAAKAETASEDASASIANALFAGTEKPIRRIVIFYRDGSFGDYQPE